MHGIIAGTSLPVAAMNMTLKEFGALERPRASSLELVP
jgi:hypothetical protein